MREEIVDVEREIFCFFRVELDFGHEEENSLSNGRRQREDGKEENWQLIKGNFYC